MTATAQTAAKLVACTECPAQFATIVESMEHEHMRSDTPEVNEKFERLLDLEFEAKTAKAVPTLQLAGVPVHRMQQMHEAAERAQAALFAAVDELTDDEKAAYGTYRAAVLARCAARAKG